MGDKTFQPASPLIGFKRFLLDSTAIVRVPMTEAVRKSAYGPSRVWGYGDL